MNAMHWFNVTYDCQRDRQVFYANLNFCEFHVCTLLSIQLVLTVHTSPNGLRRLVQDSNECATLYSKGELISEIQLKSLDLELGRLSW